MSKILKGLYWNGVEISFRQIIEFVTNLILARIIGPEAFGLVAMTSIITSISQSLMDGGFKQALIVNKNPRYEQYISIFWINIISGISLYLLIYLLAPHIASFYNEVRITSILRLTALIVPINALQIVHNVDIIRNVDFKKIALISIPSVLISSVVGILMAFQNFGVWSIVVKMLLSVAISTIISLNVSKLKVAFFFKWEEIRDLFDFGYRITLVGVLNTVYSNVFNVVIGKFFGVQMVGYYTQAKKIVEMVALNLLDLIKKVLFPYLSSATLKEDQLMMQFNKITSLSFLFILPIMSLFFFYSSEIINALYGHDWNSASQYVPVLAVSSLFLSLIAINSILVKSRGNSLIILKFEIWSKLLFTIGLVFSIKYGILTSLYVQALLLFTTYLWNVYVINAKLRLNLFDQVKFFLQNFTLSYFAGLFSIWTGEYFNFDLLVSMIFLLFLFVILAIIFNKKLFMTVLLDLRKIKL
jgi:teichuronic acid exporter